MAKIGSVKSDAQRPSERQSRAHVFMYIINCTYTPRILWKFIGGLERAARKRERKPTGFRQVDATVKMCGAAARSKLADRVMDQVGSLGLPQGSVEN